MARIYARLLAAMDAQNRQEQATKLSEMPSSQDNFDYADKLLIDARLDAPNTSDFDIPVETCTTGRQDKHLRT